MTLRIKATASGFWNKILIWKATKFYFTLTLVLTVISSHYAHFLWFDTALIKPAFLPGRSDLTGDREIRPPITVPTQFCVCCKPWIRWQLKINSHSLVSIPYSKYHHSLYDFLVCTHSILDFYNFFIWRPPLFLII